METLIETLTVRHKMIRVFFTINVELEQLGEDGMTATRSEVFAFRGQALDSRPFMEVEEGDTLRNRVALTMGDMERNLDEFLYQGSGWVISQPLFMDAEVVEDRGDPGVRGAQRTTGALEGLLELRHGRLITGFA